MDHRLVDWVCGFIWKDAGGQACPQSLIFQGKNRHFLLRNLHISVEESSILCRTDTRQASPPGNPVRNSAQNQPEKASQKRAKKRPKIDRKSSVKLSFKMVMAYFAAGKDVIVDEYILAPGHLYYNSSFLMKNSSCFDVVVDEYIVAPLQNSSFLIQIYRL